MKKKRYGKFSRKPKNVKLTREQVLAIRNDKRRPLKIIAYDYNVGISCVWDIIHRKSWKDLE